MTISTKAAGSEACRSAFGAVLTDQGRGSYIALELLAILWGTNALGQPLLAREGPVKYRRRSHDFARRIMGGELMADSHLGSDRTREILRELLESLRVPVPNRRKMPGWLGQHLYPYLGELIHYDAAPRPRKNPPINIERYTYRGGGGLAHKILRTDDDLERLQSNRIGLYELISDAGGALGELAAACASHDVAKDREDGFVDEMEAKTIVHHSAWVNHLRNGVRNIVVREVVRAKKIELLMLWVPYCIARHQLDIAATIADREPLLLPVAVVPRNTPIRQVARRELDHARGLVEVSLRLQAERMAGEVDPDDAGTYRALAGKRKWQEPYVGFFTQTLSNVGALNAHVGARHLTLQLPLLEALVCATVAPNKEVPFEDFCDTLFEDYRMVTGPRPPGGTGPLSRIDTADFRENSQQLARDLEGMGLLTAYSDATRMVHGEVL
jgi:hypothetical protein